MNGTSGMAPWVTNDGGAGPVGRVRHRRVLGLGLVWVLFSALPSGAQQDSLLLTLEQAVGMAQERHLGLRSARLGALVQERAVAQEELRFGRTLSASVSHQSTRSPSISKLEQVQTSTSNGQAVGLGLSQQLATGGSLSLDFRNNRSSSNAAFRLLDPVYQSDLALRFTQPLLQGRGRINRTGLGVARHSLEASRVAADGQARELEAQVGQAYWGLFLARAQLQLREQLLAGAQRVLESVRVRAEVGAGARSSILQAQVGVAQREEELVAAQGSLRQAEDQLKVLVGLDQEPGRWDVELVPSERPEMGHFRGEVEDGVARAVERDPAYQQVELGLRSLDLQTALAEDQVRPAVSLNALAGLSGIGATYADNLEVVREARGRSWQGGLALELPLGRTPARERVQQLRLQQRQRRLELEQRRLELAQQVRTQHRQVGISRQREEAAGWTERLAVQSVQDEEERLSLGLSTVRQVLDAQDALAQARLSRMQALVDYNDALLEWKRLTGE